MADPLLGNEAHAKRTSSVRAEGTDRGAIEFHGIGGCGQPFANQEVHQVFLTITGDAGDPEDFSLAQL